ncbi:4-hydroxy-tetrahydrodipicolinate synthase [Corynebacterium choanae]|uniref:4-hydroxy-tetrahydrodipicolinate synthase n=1 Tax=Corynebacterium choanae TaxID=1862358 RepID=A0A3G6J6R9_9CORY|nr:4-hydroxy-tetrahydrodipicolinate synthase [Corynebacterium choanae]AZA13801.1 4-hydroxy-tetrahydrodipicolinate synthase [Corynebacterium choanae]
MSTGLIATRGASSFGTVAVAMVTPFGSDGALDVAAGRKLAATLVSQGCDALVLGGTTGESPTTSDAEKITLIKEIRQEVGDKVILCAGAGSYNTAHSVALAKKAADAGADSLLVVTPYYSKPPQEGVYQHFKAVAGATDLPICLYDIPGRTATPIATETILRLAELPTVAAVKDAKGDLAAAAALIQQTELAWYSGDDPLNLAWLAVGASGFISVVGHVAADKLRALYDACAAGDLAQARRIQHELLPLTRAQAMLGGVSFAKAALDLVGLPVGDPRLPQIPPSVEQQTLLQQYLQQAGVIS